MLTLKLHGGFRAWDSRGREISIKSRKAKALLAYLASPLGKPRSRETIMALLWSDRSDEQARGSLRQALSGLRRDLGEEAAKALLVTNYDVALDLEQVEIETASPGEEFLEGLHINDPAFDEWLRYERIRQDDDSQAGNELSFPKSPNKPSVAVLPFSDFSSSSESDFFAEGLTGDLIAVLSRYRSLIVFGVDSSLLYKGQTEDIQGVRRDLGANYIVRGNVRRAGQRMRITIELVDASTNGHIWSERFDRNMEDIFDVQDEVSNKVAVTLTGHVQSSERERANKKPFADLTAYELVLIGEQLERRFTQESTRQAREKFRKAVERDPTSSRAHASMARTFLDECWAGWSENWKNAAEQAFYWAQKAVQLDPMDNRARVNLGVAYHFAKSDFDAAQVQFQKALELNPNDADAFCLQGWCYVLAGNSERAIECTDQALRLTPLGDDDCHMAQFLAHYINSRYLEALTSLNRISEPDLVIDAYRAACYAQLDRTSEAQDRMGAFLKRANEEISLPPDDEVQRWRLYWKRRHPYAEGEIQDALLSGFRKAGMPV